MHARPIYDRENADSDGHYLQRRTKSGLIENLWVGKTARHDYVEAFFECLRRYGYVASDVDQCLVSKTVGTKILL